MGLPDRAPDDQALRSAATAFVYDVFVVHAAAAADETFVQGYLLAKLGLQPARVLRIQTLELGQIITEEIERGVRSSRVTLVVLSSACMDDRWVAFGQQLAAYVSVAQSTQGVLLPLLLEDCKVTAHVQSLVKLDFRDPSREVWEAQIDRLRAHLDQPAALVPDLPCPYPGMRPFTEGDAGRFFGRDAEIERIVRWLRRGEREIYIIGASGSGKSSLIAAGLVPLLTRGVHGLPSFRVMTLRPGEQPKERLAAVLERDLVVPAAASDASVGCDAARAPLLLVIDQLEELFTIANDDQRRGFLAELRLLQSDPTCVLVFALRADFYGSFMDSSLWTDRDGRIARIDLGPLRSDSLRVIIERPARELDVYFQPELVSRLLDDAAREPGALPLLQETLFQLWGKRRQSLLALADYRALSDDARTGLAFAVKQHADDVYRELTAAQQAIAFRILLRLVNFGEGRADTRRQQPRDALRSEGELVADFEVVLHHLVKNRLMTVTGDDQHRDVRVDLAHEILIHAWTMFAAWIQTWRTHEQRRRELEAAAAAWRARGGNDGGLLDPIELASARAWQDKAARELGHSADLTAFLTASEAAHSRAIRRRRLSRFVALVTSVLMLIIFCYAYSVREQRNQRNHLVAQSANLYQNVGWQRLIESERPLQALPYLDAAGEAMQASGGTLSESLQMLFAAATRNLPISPPAQGDGRVLSAGFRSDGTQIVISILDGTAHISNPDTVDSSSLPLRGQIQNFVQNAVLSPDGDRVVTISSNHVVRVWETATGEPHSPPWQHPGDVRSAAFSPDGTRVVTVGWDSTVYVWDARTATLRSQLSMQNASLSPDGARVVTISSNYVVRVWDTATGEPHSPSWQHPGGVRSAAFSSDGTWVVTVGWDSTVYVWDARTGILRSHLSHYPGATSSPALSPDHTCVVISCKDGAEHILGPVTGVTPSMSLVGVTNAAVSSDGTLVTASEDGTARIWCAAAGQSLSPPPQHHGAVRSVAFSRDGTRIVTASEDKTARVWDAITGQPLSPSLQHQGTVWSATFSRDGTRVITASEDETARIWDAATGRPLSLPLEHQDVVRSAAFSPDGTHIVTASGDNITQMWDATTDKPLSPSLQHQGTVWSATFSREGTRVVTVSEDEKARVRDAATGKLLSSLQHQGTIRSAAFNLAGTRIVTASEDKTVRVWDAATGAPFSPALQHQGIVVTATFSRDGARVFTVSEDNPEVADCFFGHGRSPALLHDRGSNTQSRCSRRGDRMASRALGPASDEGANITTRIWDATTWEPLSPPLRHPEALSAAFSSDGTRVVTTRGNSARVWDTRTGKPLSPPLEHHDFVVSATFSSDDTRIVTASGDETARVWDAATGKPVSSPLKHGNGVATAAFNADGTRVVTTSGNSARVWDAATGEPLSPPLEHRGIVVSAAFSSDGTRVVTASEDNSARVWDAATGKPLSPPLEHQGIVRGAAFSSDGTRVITESDDTSARVWNMPLASGTLEQWHMIVDHADPYVLANGVLFPRAATHGRGARRRH